MSNAPSLKQIKRITKLFSILIVIYFAMNVYRCIDSVGKTKILNVSTANFEARTSKTIVLGENHFTTGFDGELYWKVKNIKEAFLINLGDLYGTMSFITLGYFLILNVAIYMMLWGVTEETIFSKKLTIGLNVIVYVMIFYSTLNLVSFKVSQIAIESLTDGHFSSQYRNQSLTSFILFGFLMLLISPFIKKGKSLQQEQDLTI